jgi:hypothetical protein
LRQFACRFRHEAVQCLYVEIKPHALEYFIRQFINALLFQYLKTKSTVDAMVPYPVLIETARKFIPQTTAEIDLIEKALRSEDTESAFSRVFELTTRLYKESSVRSFVVLDEFHRLGGFALKAPFQIFGKRIMLQKDTLYILTSSSFTVSRKILAEKLSLLFGNFDQIHLKPFDFRTTERYLSTKLAPLDVPPEYKQVVIALTDGHPYYLNVLCKKLLNTVLLSGKNAIDEDILVKSLRALLHESQGILNQYFLNLISMWRYRLKGNHMPLLIHLANGTHKASDLAKAIKRSLVSTSRQLKELMDEELLLKNGVFYQFHDTLLQFWLRFVYCPREFSLLVDPKSKADHFDQTCSDYIRQYVVASRLDPTERISFLFKKFKNELVEMDSKGRHLPNFSEVSIVKQRTDDKKRASIIAKTRGQNWVCQVMEEKLTEKDVHNFLQDFASMKRTSTKKMIISLKGIDQNAKLLAKNRNVWNLNLQKINNLMDLYGQHKIVPLGHRGRQDLSFSRG